MNSLKYSVKITFSKRESKFFRFILNRRIYNLAWHEYNGMLFPCILFRRLMLSYRKINLPNYAGFRIRQAYFQNSELAIMEFIGLKTD